MGIYSERQMRKGGTPLHWVKNRAVSVDCFVPTLCQKELEQGSESRRKSGPTAHSFFQSMEVMIEVGCDLNATNASGDTALHVVAAKRRLDSLIWLVIEGADVNVRGSGGDTPLHVAVRSARVPKPQDAWMLFKQKVEQKNYGRQKVRD